MVVGGTGAEREDFAQMAPSPPLLSGGLIWLVRRSGPLFVVKAPPDLGDKGAKVVSGEKWTQHSLNTSVVAGPVEQSRQQLSAALKCYPPCLCATPPALRGCGGGGWLGRRACLKGPFLCQVPTSRGVCMSVHPPNLQDIYDELQADCGLTDTSRGSQGPPVRSL